MGILICAPAAMAEYGAPSAAAGTEEKPKAEEKKSWRRQQQKPQGKAMGRKLDALTAKRLAKALEYLQEEKFDQAEQELNRLRMRSLNGFERAQTYRIYAFIEFGKGDTAEARTKLQAALDENALPPGEQASVLFQIIQLHLLRQPLMKPDRRCAHQWKVFQNRVVTLCGLL